MNLTSCQLNKILKVPVHVMKVIKDSFICTYDVRFKINKSKTFKSLKNHFTLMHYKCRDNKSNFEWLLNRARSATIIYLAGKAAKCD